MTALAEEILNSFDKLPTPEQRSVGREIFRRLVHFGLTALTDEDLVLNAEELFLALDRQEADRE